MKAYYNENDPFMAAWLRELIKDNLIAPGEVDDRDIKEVVASDLDGFQQCHFFAGIGVWSYALRKARWPEHLRVWTGSCPCQAFSSSGERRGFSDQRHLWPTWFRLIQECGPHVIFGEQVASKDGLAWFDVVSSQLESASYTVGATDLPASGVGAPHIRQRLYFVAHTDSFKLRGISPPWSEPIHERGDETRGLVDAQRRRCEQRNKELGRVQISHEGSKTHGLGVADVARLQGHARNGEAQGQEKAARSSAAAGALNGFWRDDALWLECTDGKIRPTRSGIFPVADGTPNRVGCLRGAGNALVAQAASTFIEAFMEVANG